MSRGSLLFVYGTLRRGSDHPLARRLAAHARWVGGATAAGRLYDLGSYPGLTEAGTPGECARGDVYDLADPAALLPVLDDYEGCGASALRPWLYERVRTMVILDGGEEAMAWVYYYRGPLDSARRITSGDYQAQQGEDASGR
jgi:gamma-glutamylcyclotransferase (GGCT)/AIG2-like uncharacterized protein YtfP